MVTTKCENAVLIMLAYPAPHHNVFQKQGYLYLVILRNYCIFLPALSACCVRDAFPQHIFVFAQIYGRPNTQGFEKTFCIRYSLNIFKQFTSFLHEQRISRQVK